MERELVLVETLLEKVDLLLLRVDKLLRKVNEMSAKLTVAAAQLDALTLAVAKATTVADGAMILLKGLSDEIKNLKPDQEAINALTTTLDAKMASLAQAVIDNTPTPTT